MSVVTRKETLTPKKAVEYLQHADPNRPMSEPYSQRLAGAVTDDQWHLNGETLKFNASNKLIDGQHRCRAVIIANKSIETFVTRGLSDNDFDTIDIGRRRSVGDVFAKHGEENAALLAAAVACVWRHENGHSAAGCWISPRHDQAMETLANHPKLRESIPISRGCRHLLQGSIAVAFHYLFSHLNHDLADKFFHQLATGENLAKSNGNTSGIYLLRERLLDNRTSKAKLPPPEIVAILIKAWNSVRGKVALRALRWRTEGDKPEDFPEIQ